MATPYQLLGVTEVPFMMEDETLVPGHNKRIGP